MNRRDFLISAAGAALTAIIPFGTNANAATGSATISAHAKFIAPSNPVFRNRLVTILGSSKPETCEEYVGRFFSAQPDATRFPTFSFSSDPYFVDVLRDARPKDNTFLISFIGGAADRSKHDKEMKQHMKSALRHDPDLFIFERLAGTNPTISPHDLQSLVMKLRVAGSVRAQTPAELFDLVSKALGEEVLYLTRGEPEIQVFHDMVDVTENFLNWSADRGVTT